MSEIVSLNEFLQKTKQQNHKEESKPVDVVLGNESADIDSVVSAIAFAYFCFIDTDQERIMIPVINIPRSLLSLRPEISYLLGLANVHEDNLTFVDEIDLCDLHKRKLLSLYLVDHNKLSPNQKNLSDSISYSIDHHQCKQENSHPYDVIEPVASCSTLIAKSFRECLSLSDREILKLLFVTIVVDTFNCDDVFNNVTPTDKKFLKKLNKLCNMNTEQILETYDKIVELKSSCINLKRDYKEIVIADDLRIGFSSISHSLIFVKCDDVTKFCHENNLKVLIIMSIDVIGRKRYLLLYSNDDCLCNKLFRYLTDQSELNLCLINDQEGKNFIIFHQQNAKLSRKQILPLVEKFFIDANPSPQSPQSPQSP